MEDKKIQIIKCGKCDSIFAAFVLPEAYSDAEWQRNMRKYIKDGAVVDIVDSDFRFGNCECKKSDKKQTKLL